MSESQQRKGTNKHADLLLIFLYFFAMLGANVLQHEVFANKHFPTELVAPPAT